MATFFADANKFGSLNDTVLSTFEKKHHITLPEDYRQFLLNNNGGTPSPNVVDFIERNRQQSDIVQYLYGIHKGEYWAQLEWSMETLTGRIPDQFIPIGDDPFGNQYLLGIKEPYVGQIYFWDHELEVEEGETPTFDNISFIANSFTQLLDMLHENPED